MTRNRFTVEQIIRMPGCFGTLRFICLRAGASSFACRWMGGYARENEAVTGFVFARFVTRHIDDDNTSPVWEHVYKMFTFFWTETDSTGPN